MASLKKFRVKKDMGGYSYPYTHMDLIFDDENKNLTEKLEELNNKINATTADDDVSNKEKEYVNDMIYSALGGLNFVKMTQEEYDALTDRDSNTVYIIVSAEN